MFGDPSCELREIVGIAAAAREGVWPKDKDAYNNAVNAYRNLSDRWRSVAHAVLLAEQEGDNVSEVCQFLVHAGGVSALQQFCIQNDAYDPDRGYLLYLLGTDNGRHTEDLITRVDDPASWYEAVSDDWQRASFLLKKYPEVASTAWKTFLTRAPRQVSWTELLDLWGRGSVFGFGSSYDLKDHHDSGDILRAMNEAGVFGRAELLSKTQVMRDLVLRGSPEAALMVYGSDADESDAVLQTFLLAPATLAALEAELPTESCAPLREAIHRYRAHVVAHQAREVLWQQQGRRLYDLAGDGHRGCLCVLIDGESPSLLAFEDSVEGIERFADLAYFAVKEPGDFGWNDPMGGGWIELQCGTLAARLRYHLRVRQWPEALAAMREASSAGSQPCAVGPMAELLAGSEAAPARRFRARLAGEYSRFLREQESEYAEGYWGDGKIGVVAKLSAPELIHALRPRDLLDLVRGPEPDDEGPTWFDHHRTMDSFIDSLPAHARTLAEIAELTREDEEADRAAELEGESDRLGIDVRYLDGSFHA